MSTILEALAAFVAGVLAGERVRTGPVPLAATALALLLVGAHFAPPRDRARRLPALRWVSLAAMALAGWARATPAAPGGAGRAASMPAGQPAAVAWAAAFFDRAARAHLSGNALSLYRGMVLGRRERFDPAFLESMKIAGTTHLLAVSGLNVAFLAATLELLARILRLPTRLSAWAAFPVVFLYAALVGGEPPVLRSAVMVGFFLGARLTGRRTRALDSLAGSALLLLFVRPEYLHDVSFQLSYCAVGALVLAAPLLSAASAGPAPGVEARADGPSRGAALAAGAGRAARAAVVTTLAAQCGVLPIILGMDGRVSLVAPLVNLVAVPAAGLVVPLGLLFPLVVALSRAAGHVLGGTLWALTRVVELGSTSAASWRYAAVVLGAPARGAVFAYYAGWIMLLAARGWRRAVGASLLLLAVLSMCVPGGGNWWNVSRWRHGDHEWVRVTVLDVGQGDACLAQSSRGSALLVDAGPVGGGFDAGRQRVLPFLRRAGIRELEGLVLTHAHLDHAGGAPAVLGALRVARFVDGGDAAASRQYLETLLAARERAVPWEVATRGESLVDDGLMRATVVHAGPAPRAHGGGAGGGLNEGSNGVLVESRGLGVLLLGDLGRAGESALAHDLDAGVGGSGVAVLLFEAPHHGSRFAACPELLGELHPRGAPGPLWTAISAGRGNRWGFPHPETLEALRRAGARWWVTADTGNLELRIADGVAELRDGRGRLLARYVRT